VVDLLIQLIGGCPQNKGIKPIQKNSIKDETKSQKNRGTSQQKRSNISTGSGLGISTFKIKQKNNM